MSPNYPQRYKNDLDCRWRIKAPVGSIIKFTISDFDIGEEGFGGGNLYIYQGTNIHGAILRTLINTESMPFSSTSHSLYLKFSTDDKRNGDAQGFKIKADAVGKDT